MSFSKELKKGWDNLYFRYGKFIPRPSMRKATVIHVTDKSVCVITRDRSKLTVFINGDLVPITAVVCSVKSKKVFLQKFALWNRILSSEEINTYLNHETNERTN